MEMDQTNYTWSGISKQSLTMIPCGYYTSCVQGKSAERITELRYPPMAEPTQTEYVAACS